VSASGTYVRVFNVRGRFIAGGLNTANLPSSKVGTIYLIRTYSPSRSTVADYSLTFGPRTIFAARKPGKVRPLHAVRRLTPGTPASDHSHKIAPGPSAQRPGGLGRAFDQATRTQVCLPRMMRLATAGIPGRITRFWDPMIGPIRRGPGVDPSTTFI
jgi:hypothetical protein